MSLLQKLIHQPLARQSGTLLSGQVVAQGIALLAYLVLGRLFTPADMGLYNIFYSYIEVLIILSTCKYELAIVVAESDSEAQHIARLTLRLNTIVSLVILTVALVLYLTHTAVSQLPPSLALLIPPMVYFCGTTRVYTFLSNRSKDFRGISISNIITSASGVAAKILMGLAALANTFSSFLHTYGLPLGTVLGKVAGNIYYRLRVPAPRISPDDTTSHRALLHKHRNFPLFAMPKEFVSSFSANLPFLWAAAYFDSAAIGLFGMALTFSMRPINILANSFESVFYASCSDKLHSHQPIGRDIRRFLLLLNAVAVPVGVLAFFAAEPLFVFFIGPKWVGTGYYFRCLLPWMLVLLSVNSLSFVANIFSTQRYDFGFQLLQLALRIVALLIGIHHADIRLAVLLFAAASTLVQLCQLLCYLLQIRHHDQVGPGADKSTAHS